MIKLKNEMKVVIIERRWGKNDPNQKRSFKKKKA
jgi:hypothetical protein